MAWLSRHLRPFGIHPHNIRLGGLRAKGYDLTDFTGAFARFVAPESLVAPKQCGGGDERR